MTLKMDNDKLDTYYIKSFQYDLKFIPIPILEIDDWNRRKGCIENMYCCEELRKKKNCKYIDENLTI